MRRPGTLRPGRRSFREVRKNHGENLKKGLTNPAGSGIILTVPALVAQLDRVSDYESEGQGFESLSAHQRNRIATLNFGKQCGFFFCFAQVCSLFVRYGIRCPDFPSGNCEWKSGVSVGDRFQRINLYTNIVNIVAISKGACQPMIWIKRT